MGSKAPIIGTEHQQLIFQVNGEFYPCYVRDQAGQLVFCSKDATADQPFPYAVEALKDGHHHPHPLP